MCQAVLAIAKMSSRLPFPRLPWYWPVPPSIALLAVDVSGFDSAPYAVCPMAPDTFSQYTRSSTARGYAVVPDVPKLHVGYDASSPESG